MEAVDWGGVRAGRVPRALSSTRGSLAPVPVAHLRIHGPVPILAALAGAGQAPA